MSRNAPAHSATATKRQGTTGGRVLQRKCACGSGASAIAGKCETCLRKQALGPLQAEPAMGAANDSFEREADRIAARVLEAPVATGQRVQAAPVTRIDRSSAGVPTSAAAPASVAAALRGSGEPLAPATRAFFEQRFGHDFGHVRVHRDAQASQSARDVAAHAYTVAHHMVFATGRYAPENAAGRRLIAHELTHVLQQSGPASTLGSGGDVLATGIVQRACDQPESFYRDSPNFCRDARFSPKTHPGKTCYRELLPEDAEGCPPGDHCCFAPDGAVEDSRDSSRLADEKDDDGTCGWDWGCVAKHTVTDYLPAVTGLDCYAACNGVPGAGKLWCLQSCWARK